MKISTCSTLVLALSLTVFPAGMAAAADHGGHGGHGAASGAVKPQSSQTITTKGVVESIDAANGKATLTHEPIPSMNWPKMTMRFVAKPPLMDGLKPGDKVRFDFRNEGGESILLDIEKIQ
ncbi:MAG: copper-binding protein [Desulfovibrio sp.]|jgi:Cu(I)/Ag(I) efflux system protein CusF|nr:copper-binding protein [Desulfovibrio sp.]